MGDYRREEATNAENDELVNRLFGPPQPAAPPESEPTEKDRRIYYQGIVYDVCNLLDKAFTPKAACGTIDTPSKCVQERIAILVDAYDPDDVRLRDQAARIRELEAEIESLKQTIDDYRK
jgi:hypothetical protein